MAILTGKPSSITQGSVSSGITLSPTDLISGMSITGRWATYTNWKQVVFTYTDSGSLYGPKSLGFDVINSWVGYFSASSTAFIDSWICSSIIIRDFDGGSKTIARSSFGSHTSEFDIAIVSPIVLATPFLEYNPALASGGSAPFSNNTTINGTTWKELLQSTNYNLSMVDGSTSIAKWIGTSAPYYADFYSTKVSGTYIGGTALANTLTAPTNYQALMFWYRSQTQTVGSAFAMLSNGGYNSFDIAESTGLFTAWNNPQSASVSATIPSWSTSTRNVWRLYTLVKTYVAGTSTIKGWIDTTTIVSDSAADNRYAPANVTALLGLPVTYAGYGPNGQIGQMWYFNDSSGSIGLTEITNYRDSTKATYGL